MANRVLVNENSLADIAAAIREKTGNTEASFTPGQMGNAIRAIEANAEPVIEALSITANGVYTAPEGLDGYNPITVEIEAEVIEPVVESITITENGIYTPSTGVDGFNEVEVNVPSSGGADLPEEAYIITGDCEKLFIKNRWNWYIETLGDKVQCTPTNISNMFEESNQLERIPFTIDVNNNSSNPLRLFMSCENLTECPTVINVKPKNNISNLFYHCRSLKEIPDNWIDTWDMTSFISATSTTYCSGVISNCYSLRKIPSWFGKYWPANLKQNNSWLYSMNNLYSLDEATNLPLPPESMVLTSNMFASFLSSCGRLKEFTFEVQPDGTPYTRNWSNQTIASAGYYISFIIKDTFLKYTGFTEATRVYSADTYNALKNNPDYWTEDYMYSRYNHDSAVNTINSLPITTGTGNTIKFMRNEGINTDGGSVSALTAEEIAVAAAKGWTVTIS